MGRDKLNYGTRSTAARRRMNLKYSVLKLERLLAANFTDSAYLVTLTYREDYRPRSRALAACYGADWARSMKSMRPGHAVGYVAALDWPGGPDGPVHRVLLDRDAGDATAGAVWPHGAIHIETPDLSGGWGPVAALLMRGAIEAGGTPVPCARSWTASRQLARPVEYKEERA